MKYIALFALCLCQCVFATGPSRATLKIRPLSLNEQGALLYRFKILTNPMGGHYFEPVQYGLGSFKAGKFTTLQSQQINGDVGGKEFDFETYKADTDRLDKWLDSPCKQGDLLAGFKSCNLGNRVLNQKMTVAEIRKKYGFDLTKAKGYFLLPGKLDAQAGHSIYVTHMLNDAIIAEFDNLEGCIEGKDPQPVFISNRQGSSNDYGYDCIHATGIAVKSE